MKRFFILSLLATAVTAVWACGPFGPATYNYYLFNVCGDGSGYARETGRRLACEWSRYAGGNIAPEEVEALSRLRPGEMDTTCNAIVAAARQKGDREMLDYLRLLVEYCAATPSYNEWDYPSKEDVERYADAQREVYNRSATRKSARLRDRYTLLSIRSLFRQGRYDECIRLWQNGGASLPAGVFRDMAEGFYAGALFRSDRREDACVIYARLGDVRSARFCMKDQRNLSCIRRLYDRDPASPVLPFLIQEFVNNAQETLDYQRQRVGPFGWMYEGSETAGDWFGLIGGSPVFEGEVRGFIELADRAADSKRTAAPAVWKSAAALLRYYYGDAAPALEDAEKAVAMGGSRQVADNARAIRLFLRSMTLAGDADCDRAVLPEMQWLEERLEADTCGSGYFVRVRDRVVNQGLIPFFRRHADLNTATALRGYVCQNPGRSNMNTYCDYFQELDTMTVNRMTVYHDFLFGSPRLSPFRRWLVETMVKEPVWYAELLGTKYLRLGRFAEAVTWLESVPLSFLSKQNIAPYSSRRRYDVERWFRKQKLSWEEETEPASVTTHRKLDFCREMQALEEKYSHASGEERCRQAYGLAVRYYQASFSGDCWYLTRYGVSTWNDSLRADEADFTARAAGLLAEAGRSASRTLREKSIYAAAFINYQPWRTEKYNWERMEPVYTVHRGHQYDALAALWRYTRSHRDAPAYMSRCDRLLEFARSEMK